MISSSFLAAVILGALLWPSEREPEYDGVPLSEWLERYERGKHSMNATLFVGDSKAIDAIQHIGTNALPFLVRWIQYERPAWRHRLFDASWKLPHNIQFSRTFSRLLVLGDKYDRANAAAAAFNILGPRARSAVPELTRLAEKTPMNDTYWRAIYCLQSIDCPKKRNELFVNQRVPSSRPLDRLFTQPI